VALCIQTGWIVHINGPYPSGEWHDLIVARDELCYKLADSEFEDEMAVADSGYNDGFNFFETPTGHHNEDQTMKALARARHETVNRRFKQWGVLGQRFRGKPEYHSKFFYAVANLTQFLISLNAFNPDDPQGRLFRIDYNDRAGNTVAVNNIPMAVDESSDDESL
jgi:hypothetical protein